MVTCGLTCENLYFDGLAVLVNFGCRLAGNRRTIYMAVYGKEIIAWLRKIKKLDETYLQVEVSL